VTTSNPTKKQHFIPRFYLKNFADSKGFLQILDVKNNRLGSQRPYQGVGYEHFFYAAETGVPDELSQHIEEWLKQYEDAIARDLPDIIKKILGTEPITEDDRYVLASLMCMLWLRSPSMRKKLNSMQEDMTKQLMRFRVAGGLDDYLKETGKEIPEDVRSDLLEMIKTGAYKLKFNNGHHLRFMTETLGINDRGFTNMFYGQKWKIYIAKGKSHFLTTDGPVVEWWLPPETFYGAGFLERNKYFSLTPEILIELTYPTGSAKAKRETLFDDQEDVVKIFNTLLVAHSNEFAYSENKAILEGIIAGRVKPGPIERAYYDRFQRPWAEAKRAGQV